MARCGTHPWLCLAAIGLAAWLIVVLAVRASPTSPFVELIRADWRCTARHPEQTAVATAQGQTFVTVYACDHWSRR